MGAIKCKGLGFIDDARNRCSSNSDENIPFARTTTVSGDPAARPFTRSFMNTACETAQKSSSKIDHKRLQNKNLCCFKYKMRDVEKLEDFLFLVFLLNIFP